MDPVWTRLPEDLQLRIALKLPLQDLFLSKLVCKPWCNAITQHCNTGFKAFAWRRHLLICSGSWNDPLSKKVDFQYLPYPLYKGVFEGYILSCTRSGVMLVHVETSLLTGYEAPVIITNPFTKLWHAVPYPRAGECTRLLASVWDTPQSFKFVLVITPGLAPSVMSSFHVCVYKPETGWRYAGLIQLEGMKLINLCLNYPVHPMVFDGKALYFLTVPRTGSFMGSGEYTLNRVHVPDSDFESLRLEKLLSWSALPRGMWPVKRRVHPRLVACSGKVLLVGTSFGKMEKQGPIVLLVLERESKWKVLNEVKIPGYVAKKVARKTGDMFSCGDGVCQTFKECYCCEDYLVSGGDDEVILSFPSHRGPEDVSLNFSCDLRSGRWSKFGLPVVDQLPGSRKQMVRIHLATPGPIPRNSEEFIESVRMEEANPEEEEESRGLIFSDSDEVLTEETSDIGSDEELATSDEELPDSESLP